MNPETLRAWAEFVPLAQTLLWLGFAGGLLFFFRGHIASFAESVRDRVSAGAVVETPWGSLRGAPAEVRGDSPGAATAEGASGAETAADVSDRLLAKSYPSGIVENLYLVHEAQTIRARKPGRPGQWRVHLWLEGYTERDIGRVNRVTYRLYENEFPRPVISTEDRTSGFELWLSVYGEFTVVAYVEREGAEDAWLTRYLDLPGRPPE